MIHFSRRTRANKSRPDFLDIFFLVGVWKVILKHILLLFSRVPAVLCNTTDLSTLVRGVKTIFLLDICLNFSPPSNFLQAVFFFFLPFEVWISLYFLSKSNAICGCGSEKLHHSLRADFKLTQLKVFIADRFVVYFPQWASDCVWPQDSTGECS